MLILQESISRNDRMLVFSQSLLTLDLIEEYLQRRQVPGLQDYWAKNKNYFRKLFNFEFKNYVNPVPILRK